MCRIGNMLPEPTVTTCQTRDTCRIHRLKPMTQIRHPHLLTYALIPLPSPALHHAPQSQLLSPAGDSSLLGVGHSGADLAAAGPFVNPALIE